MSTDRLNTWGNSYPEGFPIYKIEFVKDGSWLPKGTVIEVMESLNPFFKNHWRINDSQFVSKDFCRVVE